MQLLPALNQGGVERGTLDIARALVEAGHDSIVVSAGGRLVEQLEAEGSTHLALDIGRKSLSTFLKAFALARMIRQPRYCACSIQASGVGSAIDLKADSGV